MTLIQGDADPAGDTPVETPAVPWEPGHLPPASSPARSTSEEATALLEQIAGGYADGEPAALAAEAREEFLRATGRVHEGDRSFDERMALFMEWFLLDRPLPPTGRTPAELWASRHSEALEPRLRELLLGLMASHRSLFLALGPPGGRDPNRLLVDDLLRGFRWPVTTPGGLPGVREGDVLEGRIFGLGGDVHFTTAFCYHPREVALRIRRHLERMNERRRDMGPGLLDELMSLRLAYDRAEDAPASSIYRFER